MFMPFKLKALSPFSRGSCVNDARSGVDLEFPSTNTAQVP